MAALMWRATLLAVAFILIFGYLKNFLPRLRSAKKQMQGDWKSLVFSKIWIGPLIFLILWVSIIFSLWSLESYLKLSYLSILLLFFG